MATRADQLVEAANQGRINPTLISWAGQRRNGLASKVRWQHHSTRAMRASFKGRACACARTLIRRRRRPCRAAS
eukprot:2418258-Pleurochrysis_carterae.AAC.1